jgi:WD40 repeat protein
MITSLPVLHNFSVELEAKPTSVIWYPKIDFTEGLILTTNDEYKMKLWNPKLGNSRRTALGPTYGGEINKLKLLNVSDDGKYLVYSTNKKVIGLIKLPMDGNPNKTMGLIAHPDEVSDIAVSNDGKYVFTCGGNDLAVNMWSVNVSPIE